MKRCLFLILLVSVMCSLFSVDLTGNQTAHLLFEPKEELNFGLSYNPVDESNDPNPIPLSEPVSLTGTLVGTESLTGSGTVNVYWEIASAQRIKISVGILKTDETPEGKMTYSNGGSLDWCIYYEDSNGVTHYCGKDGGDGSSPLVEKNTGDDFHDYGGSFVVYNETTNVSYIRQNSQAVNILTDEAFPSDDMPAGQYSGTIQISLETIT